MIRPLTLLSMFAAAGAGLYLYQVKHSVAQLDRELRNINRQTEQARERTQVLRAEWALLNEPERLRQVAQRYLPLEAMAPTQFVRLTDLDRRLPAARSFAAPVSLFAPTEPQGDGSATALALAEGARRGQAAAEADKPTVAVEPAPRAVAEAPPAPVVVASIAPAVAPEPEPAPAPVVTRASTPREPVQAMEAPAAEVRRAPQRVAAAAVRPAPTPAPRPAAQRAVHVQRAAPVAPQVQRVSAPAVTSVLATGGPALAPPVPVARAAAATLSGHGVR